VSVESKQQVSTLQIEDEATRLCQQTTLSLDISRAIILADEALPDITATQGRHLLRHDESPAASGSGAAVDAVISWARQLLQLTRLREVASARASAQLVQAR